MAGKYQLSDILAALGQSGQRDLSHLHCPCSGHSHGDRSGSLQVKQLQDGKFSIQCMGGHSVQDIMAVCPDLTWEMIYNGTGETIGDKKVHTAKPAAKKPVQDKPQKQEAQEPKEPEKRVDFTRNYGVYEYEDADGMKLRKTKYKYIGDSEGKTFIWSHQEKDGRWASKGSSTIIKLYHSADLPGWIANGRMIYVVEGEKDADNMIRMGYAATTSPHGAAKGIGDPAGKWSQLYTEALKDADVVLMGDVDKTGVAFMAAVGRKIVDSVKSLRLVDLRTCGVDLPEKGDVSDLMELVGEAETRNIIRRLTRTDPITVDDLEDNASLRQRVQDCYKGYDIPGYTIEKGCMCKWHESDPKVLCTGMFVPYQTISHDNGNGDPVTTIVVKGWDRNGVPLPDLRVPATDYSGMRWIDQKWDMRINVTPGQMKRDELRYMSSELGDRMTRRINEYGFTGWTILDGKYVYTYEGGAIGKPNVRVHLGSEKVGSCYRMDEPGNPDWSQMSLATALSADMLFRACIMPRTSVPLLALTYLAPLVEPMCRANCKPRFVMYLQAQTGTGKSVVSSLVQSHFGDYSQDTFPASFQDTSNYVRGLLPILRDTVAVVDDLHPVNDDRIRKEQERVFDAVIRACSDNNARNRMSGSADRALTVERPIRGLVLMTGEYVPTTSGGDMNRLYIVEVQREDVDILRNPELTALQKMASQGYMKKAMRGYIEWLAPKMSELPETLDKKYNQYRAKAIAQLPGVHARIPGMVATLIIGEEYRLRYTAEVIGQGEEWVRAQMKESWETLITNCTNQKAIADEAHPAKIFIQTLRDMLSAGAVNVQSVTNVPDQMPQNNVGFYDQSYYYINGTEAFAQVEQRLKKTENSLGITRRALLQQLRTDGLIEPGEKDTTITKRIGETVGRFIRIPKRVMIGDPDKPKMNRQTEMDFKPVDTQTPFD